MSELSEHKHIVSGFDKDLLELDSKIARMGGICEQMLANALKSMRSRDPELGEETILADAEINALEREIEDAAIKMIALRQPMAQDLRQVIGALRIASELERIGDLAKNIARRAVTLSAEKHPKPIRKSLKRMGKMVSSQLNASLDAYARRNADLAYDVWQRDEEVDAMYSSMFRELVTYMMEDPRTISLCAHMLFGARNLERIGDHTTNIVEQLYFLVTGDFLSDDRPKGAHTSAMRLDQDEADD